MLKGRSITSPRRSFPPFFAQVRVFCDLYRMSQKVPSQAEERIVLAEERSKREAAKEANRRLAFLTRPGGSTGAIARPGGDRTRRGSPAVAAPGR